MTNKKLTNRQAIGVLDGLRSNPLFGEAHRQAFEIGIKAIKALEQEPWIPVSEKVPERSGEYLVSVIDSSGEDNDYKAVRVAWFAHKKDYDIKDSEWRELGIDETVTAWMSLPAPYESQESEGEE